jgi:hypothetical protein
MQYEQAHVFQTARAPAGWRVESSGQGAAARPWGAGRGRLGIDPQALGGILPPPARRTPTWTSRWQLAAGTAAGANEQQPCRQCNRGDIGAAQPLFLCASSPKFIAGYVSSQLPTSSCFPISFCGGISRHIYRRSHRRMSRSLPLPFRMHSRCRRFSAASCRSFSAFPFAFSSFVREPTCGFGYIFFLLVPGYLWGCLGTTRQEARRFRSGGADRL